MVRTRRAWAMALAGALALLDIGIEASGAESRFPARIRTKVGAEPVTMALTGTAMRKAYNWFDVYAIGSYVREGTRIRTAEELARADVLKQLHLILERDIEGDDMAKAFQAAFELNNPPGAFAREMAELTQFLRTHPAGKGDHVWLTYHPGVGLRCFVVGQGEVVIQGVPFARALWEVYLGPNNLGVAIKTGLVSRL